MEGRKMLKENGIPYLRPDDYLAEMMKDDKKMKMIEKRKETIEEEKKQKLRQVIIRNKNKKRSNRKKYSRRSLPCSNKHSKNNPLQNYHSLEYTG